MAYEIEYAPAAERALRKLPRNVQAQLVPVIEAPAATPRPRAAVKLGEVEGYGCYRVRSGNYRVICMVLDDVVLVLIAQLGHRKEVYRRFEEAARRAMRQRSSSNRILTASAGHTIAVGERLGKLLQPGDVVALYGDLGAGKTVLTKGIALGLGVEAEVHSPTFTLIHEHPGPIPLYHVDLYRLESEAEVETIGVEEYIESGGVTVIEWAEKMRSLLPAERLDVTLRMTGDTTRAITFETDSPRLKALLEELSNARVGD